MSQWAHNEKDLNMSKYFRCFTDSVHSWAGRLKLRGVVGALLLSLSRGKIRSRANAAQVIALVLYFSNL